MITRRLLLVLPALTLPALTLPALTLAASPARTQPADPLVAALIACWQARGIRFTADQVAQRIGGRHGKAALLALAGAAESADGDEVEIAVEILWEAGAPPSPALPLMQADLARGLPLLLITRAGSVLLLHGLAGTMVTVRDPVHEASVTLDWQEAALIGRPVIAGA